MLINYKQGNVFDFQMEIFFSSTFEKFRKRLAELKTGNKLVSPSFGLDVLWWYSQTPFLPVLAITP